VAETWRLLQGKLVHSGPMCRNEWWILWRRIAGGLAAGQQQALADPLLPPVRALHRQLTTGKGRGGDISFQPHETPEMWRLLGSLEMLDVRTRVELGRILVDLLPKRKMEPVRGALAWALGRIGARVPVYGPLNTVVPVDEVAPWLQALLDQAAGDPMEKLAVMELARRTQDRYRDVPDKLRHKAVEWLHHHDAPAHFLELVEQGGALDSEEQGLVFGEALPKGLRIG
jgi:hypothetical protein